MAALIGEPRRPGWYAFNGLRRAGTKLVPESGIFAVWPVLGRLGVYRAGSTSIYRIEAFEGDWYPVTLPWEVMRRAA